MTQDNMPASPLALAVAQLRGCLVQVAVFSAVVNVLMLTGPVFMTQVYDRVLASASVPTLLGLFAIVVVLFAFLGLYDYLRVRLLSRAGYRLDAALGDDGFRLWLDLGRGGNRASRRPLHDLSILRGFMTNPGLLAVFDLPWVPIYLGIVFLIHPWLGVLTLGGAMVTTGLALASQRITAHSYKQAMGMDARESFFVEQSYRNAEALTALGMAGRVRAQWRRLHDEGLATGQAGGDVSEGVAAFSKAFRLLMQSAILALGAYLVIWQEMSAGLIVATSIIAGRALAPIDQLIGQWRAITRAQEAWLHLKGALAEPAPRPGLLLPDPLGHLSVVGLTKFAPGQRGRGERPPLLADVGFALVPGDALGVIGPSASGKSTLARLLVGAWLPDAGEVRLDGATLDQWTPEALGRHIGYLPQTLELMAGTLRDNICRFDPAAEDAAVVAAARLAGVHEMILALPKGYDTRIESGSQPLSGGQIQRLGLARAVYGAPRLVVLDEPNAHLDASGDEALARAILALRQAGATVVVMAHRPSAIAAVNKVLVLQAGRVAHFGDKDSVLAQATRPAAAAAVGVTKGMADAG